MGWANRANDPLIDKIAGLILLGDPGKPANVTERLYSSKKADPPNPPAGYVYDLNKASATVKARAGYFAQAFPQHYGHLPGTLPSKTWNICHERDFVCAAGPGTKFSDHASIWYPVYTVPEIQRNRSLANPSHDGRRLATLLAGRIESIRLDAASSPQPEQAAPTVQSSRAIQ